MYRCKITKKVIVLIKCVFIYFVLFYFVLFYCTCIYIKNYYYYYYHYWEKSCTLKCIYTTSKAVSLLWK